VSALFDEMGTDSVELLQGVQWPVALYALGVLIVLAGGILLLRRVLFQGAPSLGSRRLIWLVELALAPALIVVARESLLGLGLEPRLAGGVEIVSRIALCLALAWLADRAVTLFFLERADGDSAVRLPGILRTGIRIALYALAGVAALALIRDDETLGFVVSGSVLLGVLGLALQGVLQDAFAGIALSLDEPFKLGDWIELEDGTIGQVRDMSWRTTQVRSLDQGIIVIPNSRISATRIHNHTTQDERHALLLRVNLSNEVDPVLARRLLLEALLATPGVLPAPAPTVRVEDGGSRPCRYLLHFFCRDFPSKYKVTSEVYETVWRHLREHQIFTSPAASDIWLFREGARRIQEESIEALLQETPLFQSLNDTQRQALQSAVHHRVFPAGTIVFREHDDGDSVFIILSGRVEVLTSRRGGALARLGAGDYFGEMSLLTGGPRTATVRTATECTLLEIERDTLAPMLKELPELEQELTQVEERRYVEMKSELCEAVKDVFIRYVGPIAYEIADEAYQQWLAKGNASPSAVEDYITLLADKIVDPSQRESFSNDAHRAIQGVPQTGS